jgi:hypothetical protein
MADRAPTQVDTTVIIQSKRNGLTDALRKWRARRRISRLELTRIPFHKGFLTAILESFAVEHSGGDGVSILPITCHRLLRHIRLVNLAWLAPRGAYENV